MFGSSRAARPFIDLTRRGLAGGIYPLVFSLGIVADVTIMPCVTPMLNDVSALPLPSCACPSRWLAYPTESGMCEGGAFKVIQVKSRRRENSCAEASATQVGAGWGQEEGGAAGRH
jgi:hypothetical protein